MMGHPQPLLVITANRASIQANQTCIQCGFEECSVRCSTCSCHYLYRYVQFKSTYLFVTWHCLCQNAHKSSRALTATIVRPQNSRNTGKDYRRLLPHWHSNRLRMQPFPEGRARQLRNKNHIAMTPPYFLLTQECGLNPRKYLLSPCGLVFDATLFTRERYTVGCDLDDEFFTNWLTFHQDVNRPAKDWDNGWKMLFVWCTARITKQCSRFHRSSLEKSRWARSSCGICNTSRVAKPYVVFTNILLTFTNENLHICVLAELNNPTIHKLSAFR